MGGSKQTQTTSSEKNPWAPAQPLLNDILSKAQSYGNDASMFTPTFSTATKAGVAGIQALGGQPLAAEGAFKRLADGTSQSYDAGLSTLMGTAQGQYLNGANPHLDGVLATARRNAADSVNAQFSGAGRYGSGAHTGVLSDKLGAIETQARYDDYNKERTRQLEASGLLHSAGLQQGQYASGADQAQAARNQFLLQGGALEDQMSTAERTAPLQATQWQAGLGLPIAGLGGTSNSTSTTQTPANVGGMIGSGLMTGLGVMTGNPMMALSGLGGMGSAFGGGAGASPAAGMGGGGGGMFSPGPVFSQPGTAANGGWSTTATPTSGWGSFGSGWWGG